MKSLNMTGTSCKVLFVDCLHQQQLKGTSNRRTQQVSQPSVVLERLGSHSAGVPATCCFRTTGKATQQVSQPPVVLERLGSHSTGILAPCCFRTARYQNLGKLTRIIFSNKQRNVILKSVITEMYLYLKAVNITLSSLDFIISINRSMTFQLISGVFKFLRSSVGQLSDYAYDNYGTTKSCYDISFLKRFHLIIDGDIESNPRLIPIEAYRVATGKFNIKHVSRINGSVHINGLVKMYHILFFPLISSILLFLLNIMLLSMIFIILDLSFKKCANYVCINNKYYAVNNFAFYDLSHLKRLELLLDGDIESNPGPTQSRSCKSSAGRPKKSKVFKGTPKKVELGNKIDFVVNRGNPVVPLGLVNQGENVCFFNSVIQVLYSLPTFRSYIEQLQTSERVVSKIKDLFTEIRCSNEPVRTSTYISDIDLQYYVLGMQYDAHECLLQLLAKIYSDINVNCMFKIDKLESTLCMHNDCGHTLNNNGVCIDWSLHINDSMNIQSISGLLREVMDPTGKHLQGYRCDRCHRVNTTTKSVCPTQLSDAFVIQLNVFRFIDGSVRKVIPSLRIDQEISLWGNTMTLSGIIYHEGEQPNCGHYTSAVKMNNAWFLISDTVVWKERKLTCTQRDSSVPYILVYTKRNNAVSNLYNPAAEILSRRSLLNELDKQKTFVQEKSKRHEIFMFHSTSKSPVKRKKHLTNISSKERVKTFRNNVHDAKKAEIRIADKKKKKETRDSLDNAKKAEIRIANKKKMQETRDSLDDAKKTEIRIANKKKKKETRDSLDDAKKAEIRMVDKRKRKEKRDSLDNAIKKTIKNADKKRKTDKRYIKKDARDEAFDNVQGMSMVDPAILGTAAYKIIEKDFRNAIMEGPTYVCDICIKTEQRKTVIKLNANKYEKEMFEKCHKGIYEWICQSCHNFLSKGKMPPQAQANNLELCPKVKELDDLCPIELMLISQIIPFMFIVAKHKGAQHGLKGQCVLVPADLKKIQTTLPRSCDDEHLISLTLKRRLSDTSYVNKQNIRPALVNKALEKLVEINPFYNSIHIDDSWEDVSKESDSTLWSILTDENAKPDEKDKLDSDDEIEGNDHAYEKEKKKTCVPFPTVLHNIDGPNVSPDQIVNIAPGEGQIPVSFTSEPDWEALAFPKEYSIGKGHFNDYRNVAITPSKYVHARLKCSDDRFASNPQYIFHALDWIEKNAVASSIHFAERKHFQGDINAGQVTSNNVRHMISDDQIFASFKSIRGTPQ